MAVSSNRFWDQVCAGLDDAIAAWPPDRMTEEQKTAEMERMVRRGKAARAEAEGLPPPWVKGIEERLDRIEAARPGIADPPCGAMSRPLGFTVSDLRRMGFLDASDAVRGRKRPRPPKPWRRVCVCELGHAGEWHRSEDGQVWHDVDAMTAEEVAAEEERQRQVLAEMVKADTSGVRMLPDEEDE